MARQKRLVIQHLEDISWQVLEAYPQIVKEMIHGKSGVYALYRRGKLYYVGLATNLMARLKIHLRDRHQGEVGLGRDRSRLGDVGHAVAARPDQALRGDDARGQAGDAVGGHGVLDELIEVRGDLTRCRVDGSGDASVAVAAPAAVAAGASPVALAADVVGAASADDQRG